VKRRARRIGHGIGWIRLTGCGVGEFKPHPHEIAKDLLRITANSQLNEDDRELLGVAAQLLLALPAPRRGRRSKASTLQAMELAVKYSVRKAARLIADRTGENPENIRVRLLGIKRRARKGGNKFK
jgi:hypothetical protein